MVLRVLVATACVAVIAFVGYFFWNERLDRLAAVEAERNAARARVCAVNEADWAAFSEGRSIPSGSPPINVVYQRERCGYEVPRSTIDRVIAEDDAERAARP